MEDMRIIKKEDLAESKILGMLRQIREKNEELYYRLRHECFTEGNGVRLSVLEYLVDNGGEIDLSDIAMSDTFVNLCRHGAEPEYIDFIRHVADGVNSENLAYYLMTIDDAVEKNIPLDVLEKCYEEKGEEYYTFSEAVALLEEKEPEEDIEKEDEGTERQDEEDKDKNPEKTADGKVSETALEKKVLEEKPDEKKEVSPLKELKKKSSQMIQEEETPSRHSLMETEEDVIGVIDELRESFATERNDSSSLLNELLLLHNETHNKETEIIMQLTTNHNKDNDIIKKNNDIINCQKNMIKRYEQKVVILREQILRLEKEVHEYKRSMEKDVSFKEKFREMYTLLENHDSVAALPDKNV